ncbi:cytochrome c peroxidase [Nitratiruptor sp. YY08-26]|uniref:cytochrome-c peroxidase n=1 Tax=unclassified Nitratiruptor TaxID=2624044 RepID=UPI00191591AE|nr:MULTISPECIES: cytochrome-c peroxidase [unclassified Nitratiruptor]BCD61321.1 cytochrome c peroxidase [Nitratiruptor sp. YY08-13]BCD65254.1 cytochrome c peroxidase [Nitratiruptor sp. YY08-26]
MKIAKSVVLATALISVSAFAKDALIEKAKQAGLQPIPQEVSKLFKLIDNPQNPITKAKVELGKKLYFDPRLSRSGLISCNTCHNLSTGGDDNVPVATGHKWRHNPHHLNSPTVYNAVFNQKQFWDGRSPDLEDQATGPIQADVEMNMPKNLAVKVVKSIPEYKEAFAKVYPGEEITIKTIGKAIGAFERTLVTPSRYDDYLNGDEKALTEAEKEGLKTFIEVGCASCHNGVGLGGGMAPFPAIGKYKYANIGDFKGDKNGMVKVPTLRNILETAPYFHNGATYDIKESIEIMAETQLGKKLTKKQIDSIATFFKALTGKKPYVRLPMLPNSTPSTPKPDLN